MTTLRGFKTSEPVQNTTRGPQLLRDGGRADFMRPVPNIRFDKITEEDLVRNQFLRLNTIYKIVDADGKLCDFEMREEQYDFWRNMHSLNIILKARQIGFTTLIQLFLLDTALFTPNTSCGVIAHNQDDANRFFSNKIKLAYDHIPEDFKRKYCPSAEINREGEIKFSNGSSLVVGTSLRSGTFQYLHISEFGKLCAKFPQKADEVVAGALNTVSAGNWITIESTGEGAHGHFYDMAEAAKSASMQDRELSTMEYKFFFYPWWTTPDYTENVYALPSPAQETYFKELDKQSGITLTRAQRNWYVFKQRIQKDKMWREFPSTPDEAFRGIIEGAPLSRVMARLRQRGHVRSVPWRRSLPVDTFWDLGRNDDMAIWFMQRDGFENLFIDYYSDKLRPLSDYAQVCNERGYIYGTHYLPHDADNVDLSQTDGKSRKEILEDLLLSGECYVVPRIVSEEAGVNMTREVMDNCYFDAIRCAQGIKCLENVRYRWDDKLQSFQPNLMRTWAKHGYDAFAQYGHGYRHRAPVEVERTDGRELARGSRMPRGRKREAELKQRGWKT